MVVYPIHRLSSVVSCSVILTTLFGMCYIQFDLCFDKSRNERKTTRKCFFFLFYGFFAFQLVWFCCLKTLAFQFGMWLGVWQSKDRKRARKMVLRHHTYIHRKCKENEKNNRYFIVQLLTTITCGLGLWKM